MTIFITFMIIGILIGFIIFQWCNYVCTLANDFRICGNKGFRKSRLEKFLDGLEVLEKM